MTDVLLRPTVVILTKNMSLARSLLVTLSDIQVECEATFDNPRHALLHTRSRSPDACLITPSQFLRDELRDVVSAMRETETKAIAILARQPQNTADVESYSAWMLASNDMYKDLKRVFSENDI